MSSIKAAPAPLRPLSPLRRFLSRKMEGSLFRYTYLAYEYISPLVFSPPLHKNWQSATTQTEKGLVLKDALDVF